MIELIVEDRGARTFETREIPCHGTVVGFRKALSLLACRGQCPKQVVTVVGGNFGVSIGHGYAQPFEFWVDFVQNVEE